MFVFGVRKQSFFCGSASSVFFETFKPSKSYLYLRRWLRFLLALRIAVCVLRAREQRSAFESPSYVILKVFKLSESSLLLSCKLSFLMVFGRGEGGPFCSLVSFRCAFGRVFKTSKSP